MKKKINFKILSFIILGVLLAGGVYFKFQNGNHQSSPVHESHSQELYHCPMHPSITSDKPGTCPICHMPLQKVEQETEQNKILRSAQDDTSLEGRSSFTLSEERQQLIGVATAPVERRSLQTEVRATGRVAFDPELFTAIEEYTQARLAQKQMKKSPYETLREQAEALVSASATKLKIMGLSEDQIKSLSDDPDHAMSLILPKGKVWIYAEVFEFEIAGIQTGQMAEVVAPALPGKIFSGRIASISPILNAPTRTFRVRTEVPDPEGVLRPDTYVNVKIKIDLGNKLSVPEDAVLHAGDRDFVFVVVDQGHFEPQAVVLGQKTKEYYEIIEGLKEGDKVVTGATFLIDSESKLKSAIQQMKQAPSNPHQGH